MKIYVYSHTQNLIAGGGHISTLTTIKYLKKYDIRKYLLHTVISKISVGTLITILGESCTIRKSNYDTGK